MAISYVTAGTVASTATAATLTPGTPAGIANNDILVVGAATWGNRHPITIDNSFTAKFQGWAGANVVSSGYATSSLVAWKRTTGTEGTTTVTFSGTNDTSIARMWAFRGVVTTGDPFEAESWLGFNYDSCGMMGVFNQQLCGSGSTGMWYPAMTTLTNGAWPIWVMATCDNNTVTVPSGGNVANLNLRTTDPIATGSDGCLTLVTSDLATAGYTGMPTGGMTGPDSFLNWGGALKAA